MSHTESNDSTKRYNNCYMVYWSAQGTLVKPWNNPFIQMNTKKGEIRLYAIHFLKVQIQLSCIVKFLSRTPLEKCLNRF